MVFDYQYSILWLQFYLLHYFIVGYLITQTMHIHKHFTAIFYLYIRTHSVDQIL